MRIGNVNLDETKITYLNAYSNKGPNQGKRAFVIMDGVPLTLFDEVAEAVAKKKGIYEFPLEDQ